MLKFVLIANAVSCAVFGVVFIFWAQAVASLLGSPPSALLYVLGVGLLLNAILLLLESRHSPPRPAKVRSFAIGDGIWVLASLGLIFSGTWVTTMAGIVWTVCVAVFVGGCGILQFILSPTPELE